MSRVLLRGITGQAGQILSEMFRTEGYDLYGLTHTRKIQPDKISIYINKSSSFIFESLMKHKTFICSETQALDFRIIDEIITSNKVEFDLGRKMDKDSICFKISKS